MLRSTSLIGLSVCALLALVDSASASVTFQLVKIIDTAALGGQRPGSVAARGNHLYFGGLFGGARLHHVTDPMGAANLSSVFGGINNAATNGGLGSAGGTSNGYTNMHTDGRTLVASTENGGGTRDVLQSYSFGTTNLNFGANSGPASLNTQTGRLDGAAVDPVTGKIMTVGFGGDAQNFYDPATGAAVSVPAANILFFPGVGTGWKDVAYDQETGDLYLRSVGGIARGRRVADGEFQTLTGGAGVQTIANNFDDSASAINVEFIPASAAGQDIVIGNGRGFGGTTFAEKIRVYDSTPPLLGNNAIDTLVATTFVGLDGVTPFSTTSADSGIYDFSWDPANRVLWVSDFSAQAIYGFAVPAPSAGMLLAGAGLLAARRRR